MSARKGLASEFAEPLRWFRDEDGIEWSAPHDSTGKDCPWGACSMYDEEQPLCHTVEGDTADWIWFIENDVFVKEIV